jgi:hypothetical protein
MSKATQIATGASLNVDVVSSRWKMHVFSPERFFTKLEQIHAPNFLKGAVEHVLHANPQPFVKHLLNTSLFKNL